MSGKGQPARETIRLDKWLYQARFFKTRGMAADLAGKGRIRVNGQRTDKPARAVGEGDVLTFPQAGRIRVVRVLACGERRGPATEAAQLYDDLKPEDGEWDETPDDGGDDAADRPLE
ncbi:RNA-binding S4 domain-containing protein [Pseudoroseicyclus sp. H15]